MPLIIALGSFQKFSKIRGDICKSSAPPGINDTGGKFATSTTSVIDTGGNFAAGVIDIGGYLSQVSTTPTANLANNGNTYQTAQV